MNQSTTDDRISVRLGKQRKQRMVALCWNTGLSISRLTQQAIDRELQRIASEILVESPHDSENMRHSGTISTSLFPITA